MCAMHVLELMSANLCIFLHVDMKAHVDLYVCSVNVVKKAYLICIVYMQNIREHTPVYVQTPRALTHFTILKVNCCVSTFVDWTWLDRTASVATFHKSSNSSAHLR